MDDYELLELANNPTPRTPVCLVLDTSGSMHPAHAELNDGIESFFQDVADDVYACKSVEVAVVTFDTDIRVVQSFIAVESMETIPQIQSVQGMTNLSGGVLKGLELLEARKASYAAIGVPYHQPWLVVMSDGHPTDSDLTELEGCYEMTRTMESANKLVIFPIAITSHGEDALPALAKLTQKRRPLRISPGHFREFFAWLSASTKATSQSQTGESVSLPSVDGWANI